MQPPHPDTGQWRVVAGNVAGVLDKSLSLWIADCGARRGLLTDGRFGVRLSVRVSVVLSPLATPVGEPPPLDQRA